jgi:diguanylate cyclase (GGDEF)-like protein
MKLVTRFRILSVLTTLSLFVVLGYLISSHVILDTSLEKQRSMHKVNSLLNDLALNAELYLESRDGGLLELQQRLNNEVKVELDLLLNSNSNMSLYIKNIRYSLESNDGLLMQLANSFNQLPTRDGRNDVVNHLKSRLLSTYVQTQKEATTLSDEMWVEQLKLIQDAGIALAILVIAAIMTVGFSHLNFASRFQTSLSIVLNGLIAIREGNLKSKISVKSHNELSEIADGVNRMAQSLNELTVSKAELEAIVASRTIELEAETRTDSLTGVHNRRSLNRVGSRELSMARRYGQSLSILMIDLDLFKLVNDDHGHAFGDTVLVQAAKTITAQLRNSDFLARFGGEEFTVLLPHSDRVSALDIAERIRESFETTQFGDENQKIQQTVSIGIAVMTDKTTTLDELIAIADSQLYQAKNNGRNRCSLPS